MDLLFELAFVEELLKQIIHKPLLLRPFGLSKESIENLISCGVKLVAIVAEYYLAEFAKYIIECNIDSSCECSFGIDVVDRVSAVEE